MHNLVAEFLNHFAIHVSPGPEDTGSAGSGATGSDDPMPHGAGAASAAHALSHDQSAASSNHPPPHGKGGQGKPSGSQQQ